MGKYVCYTCVCVCIRDMYVCVYIGVHVGASAKCVSAPVCPPDPH